MNTLPVEVLMGISFGLLFGVVPSVAVGVSSFLLGYFTESSLPSIAAPAVALPVAGANGYFAGAISASQLQSQAPRLTVAVFVVFMLSVYANSQGEILGESLPKNISRATHSDRTLSANAMDSITASGSISVRPTDGVSDVEGHPPLSPDRRAAIENDTWHLPADLPLPEIEKRVEDIVRTEYDLFEVSASVDPQGQATISAAPPSNDLAQKVSDGRRAISVTGELPTGLAPGDEVTVLGADRPTVGTVVSVSATGGVSSEEYAAPDTGRSGGNGATIGGYGRVTVSVPTAEARNVLTSDELKVVANSHGSSQEFEALSLVEDAGETVRKVVPGAEGVDVLQSDGDVQTLAVRRSEDVDEATESGWTFVDGDSVAPDRETFLLGSPEAIAAVQSPGSAGTSGGGSR